MKKSIQQSNFVQNSLTIIGFIVGVIIIWYLFICKSILDDESKIPTIIACLGLLISLVQFRIISLKRKQDNKNKIRLTEYYKIRELLNDFTSTINEDIFKDPIDVASVLTKLISAKNEIAIIINTNDSFLFPDLNKMNGKKVGDLMDKILKTTEEYYKSIEEKSHKLKNSEKLSDIIKALDIIAWHNDIRNDLMELHKEKYNFLKYLQKYLI